jgi:hypothetical protein
VRLPAVTFVDEYDFTERPESPEEMDHVPPGDGAWPGAVDKFHQSLCREKAPVALQRLLNDFHHARPSFPVHFPFEGVCKNRGQ